MNLSESQKALIEKWWVIPTSRYTVTALWSSKEKRDGRYPVMLVRMDTTTGDLDRECIIAWHLTEDGCTAKIRAIDDYVAKLDAKWQENQSLADKRAFPDSVAYGDSLAAENAPESGEN